MSATRKAPCPDCGGEGLMHYPLGDEVCPDCVHGLINVPDLRQTLLVVRLADADVKAARDALHAAVEDVQSVVSRGEPGRHSVGPDTYAAVMDRLDVVFERNATAARLAAEIPWYADRVDPDVRDGR